MDALDLLPCPFCGGPVEMEQTTGGYEHVFGRRQWWGVVCRNTRNAGGTCAVQTIPSASKETAARRWNTRAAVPNINVIVAALTDAERSDLAATFCTNCGVMDPDCRCWDDS